MKTEYVFCRTCFSKVSIDEIFNSGWRLRAGWAYCLECREKGKGGPNILKINGVWLNKKEYQDFIEKTKRNKRE